MASNKVSITLVLFICITLISTNIYAVLGGGWTLGGGIANGASTVYHGTKDVLINGKNVVQKGVATVTPTATGVAKVLSRGVAGYALSVAVEQLLGAVDWVLDPANNQIVYTSADKPVDPNKPDPSVRFLWYAVSTGSGKFYSSPTAAGKEACMHWGFTYKSIINNSIDGGWGFAQAVCINQGGQEALQNLSGKPSAAYNPEAPSKDEQKTIPLETVAQKVISNAEGGDVAAQEATKAAAADIVAEAEKDSTKARPIVNQLESSAETETDETATGESTTKDPTTGETTKTDISLEFPKACEWAPSFCQAANVVINFPITLTDWWETSNTKADGWANSISQAWTTFKDWIKEEPSKDDQVEIQEKQPEQKTVDLNFGSACPAPVVLIDSTFYDQPFKIEYSFNDFCSILSDFVRPVLIAMGAFIAALILGGVKTNE